MSIKVIFISGNIGSGKETMLRYLDESLTNRGIKVKTILEPVELWRESGMLRRLYNGEYLEFQKYAITSRIDTMNAKYQEAINENCKLVLVETNPFVDLYMFILEQLCKTFMNTLNIGKTRLNVFFLTSRSVIIYSSMYHPKYV